MRTRCLWCDGDVEKGHNLVSVLMGDLMLCGKCQNQFKIIKEEFVVDKIRALALYEYNEFFSSVLIQYKECFDEALKGVFLACFNRYISYRYRGYTMVAIPSSKQKYEERGFHHVKQMFENVKLPWCDVLEKRGNVDQKKLSLMKRKNIELVLIDGVKIPSKILLVDDVYTTGSTIKKAIALLKEDDRVIKVLVVAKVVEKCR